MEQAVGDQCPLKSLMPGAQWREHVVISQAVAVAFSQAVSKPFQNSNICQWPPSASFCMFYAISICFKPVSHSHLKEPDSDMFCTFSQKTHREGVKFHSLALPS